MVVGGLSCLTAAPVWAVGPAPIRLWPQGAPGAVGDEEQDHPELLAYLPPDDRASGTAVVICPGGGYGILATDHEGTQVAQWLNTIGVAGFVLKYRLAPRYRHPAPLQDVQRALRHVRSHGAEYGTSPKRLGIMGFSAGGHLASTAATHFDAGQPDSTDPVEKVSCRPNFAILGYPVISLTADFGHKGSVRNLLGENPSRELLELLSNEKQVTPETPPTFLFHTGEDTGVPAENSLAFYAALRKARVPAELHIYQNGPHGIGLAPGDPVVSQWPAQLAGWLQSCGFLTDAGRAAVQGSITLDGQPLKWGQITFIPESPFSPVAYAPVSRGKYSISAARGPVVGFNRIEVRDLGAVEPRQTIEKVRVYPVADGIRIGDGPNTGNVDLKSE